jgi:hypothetical protein
LRKQASKLVCTSVAACMVLVFLLQTGASAQTVPKPSVPEFTLRYVDRSYDIAPTSTTDPYNGETTAVGGGHVENRTIEITIKNPPFQPQTLPDGNLTELRYEYESKGSHTGWIEGQTDGPNGYWIKTSTGQFTVIVIQLDSDRWADWADHYNIGVGSQLDFRVKSEVGYSYMMGDGDSMFPSPSEHFKVLESSDWGIQTLTLSTNSVTSSPVTSSPTPLQTGTPAPQQTVTPPLVVSGSFFGLDLQQTQLLVAFTVIAVLAVALVIIWRKRTTPKKIISDN